MKYLLVDTYSKGHHLSYIMALAAACDGEVTVMMPADAKEAVLAQQPGVRFEAIAGAKYGDLLKQIKALVKREKIDLVHFVYADAFMKQCGLGMAQLGCKTVATFHQIRDSRLRTLMRKVFFRQIDCGVVHTAVITEQLKTQGIRNVHHIEYPCFQAKPTVSMAEAREQLNIPGDVPVLLALAGTRFDKGLDLLLTALQQVKEPFWMLIAGKELDIKRDQIEALSASYSGRVTTILRFLTDDELNTCLSACDYVVLPYRRSFNGASGPLGEGVMHGKALIAADHGSLGNIVKSNHLGYTFESENTDALAQTISAALKQPFERDEAYRTYQNQMDPENFRRSYVNLYQETMKK